MSAYPDFPQLSRKPALKTKGTTIDPTLRDTMENGMETTRAKFTRQRRQWTVTIEHLTAEDAATLQAFVTDTAVYGAKAFLFPDERDPHNPTEYLVRFSKLPEQVDEGWVADQLRQTTSFELREV